MQSHDERWRELCEQAAAEEDGERLLEIVRELNRVLNAKAGCSEPAMRNSVAA